MRAIEAAEGGNNSCKLVFYSEFDRQSAKFTQEKSGIDFLQFAENKSCSVILDFFRRRSSTVGKQARTELQ